MGWPVASWESEATHPRFYRACHALIRGAARLCRYRVIGAERIPAEGPFIIAANHQSHIDPPVVSLVTRRPLSFMALDELFGNPVLRVFMKRLNAYPISRSKPDLQALRTGLRLLRDERGLVIFPEGMRSPDGKLLQPKLGVALLALRSRAPVIPVAVDGTNRVFPVWGTSDGKIRVFPRNRQFPWPCRFTLRVGEPITFDELYDKDPWGKDDQRHVACTIMEGLAELLGQTFKWDPDEKWWRRFPNRAWVGPTTNTRPGDHG